jgi:hypothetical protein
MPMGPIPLRPWGGEGQGEDATAITGIPHLPIYRARGVVRGKVRMPLPLLAFYTCRFIAPVGW